MSGVNTGEGMKGSFVSSFTHALDPKKRLTIPSEWREQVGESGQLYVLPDVHTKSLFVFPAAEMMHRIQSVRQYGVADKKARNFLRVLASRSDLVSWDSQGRIRVKDELLSFAGLIDQVAMVGAFDHFELWNPELYSQAAMDEDSLRDAAQYAGF